MLPPCDDMKGALVLFPAVTEAIEIPQFIGRSYLTYDNRDILKRLVGKFLCVCVFFNF